ncbi:tetratricopeptide repeat protein [Nodosilinea sp. FACHB-131]|uniref:tetratricopeptide repeat protein n=1 Tax=Cyanophyceae TaxID=3028117 RepID=UPI001687283C|nr:tetratricopeptide repeat protein [Nodosilinea sp. FACHB-131]MBD1877155.1 tetratricopeptide repeat protein [Nodosilinea sp. FACHB-131]
MKQSLSEAHPAIARSLNNLALLYESQGRYKEAELLYLEASAMMKQFLGEAHPETITVRQNLERLVAEL